MANATSRRSLFAAASAAALGSGIAAGGAASVADFAEAPADAQLIAIGAEARYLTERYNGLLAKWWEIGLNEPELGACADEMDVPHDRLCNLADRARDLPALTAEGWQAKAVLIRHAMVIEHSFGGTMQFETFDQEMIWSLICDMTGRA